MEPRKDKQQSAPEQSKGPRTKRFQLIKLEERIAPKAGNGNAYGQTNKHCGYLSW